MVSLKKSQDLATLGSQSHKETSAPLSLNPPVCHSPHLAHQFLTATWYGGV